MMRKWFKNVFAVFKSLNNIFLQMIEIGTCEKKSKITINHTFENLRIDTKDKIRRSSNKVLNLFSIFNFIRSIIKDEWRMIQNVFKRWNSEEIKLWQITCFFIYKMNTKVIFYEIKNKTFFNKEELEKEFFRVHTSEKSIVLFWTNYSRISNRD